MFYETAQTVGPGWHRSFKPSHYEDMTWSPSSNKAFKSPDTSPQTYRRIIHMDDDDDFPKTSKDQADDDFFGGRRSPPTTLPRRIFKEVWTEAPSGGGHRFGDSRPRLFKRVFRPGQWEEEFMDKDVPHVRRVERHFDDDRPLSRHFDDDRPRSRHFDDDRPLSRNLDEEFDRRFGGSRDFKKDLEEEFEKAEGRVHHIPIMVERRMEEMKSRFGKNDQDRRDRDGSEGDWEGPQVQNLRRAFEPDRTSSKYSYRFPKSEPESRARSFTSPLSDSWDPHAIHTLPTRKVHKSSQSFDDPRSSPKSVFRSYSETHEEKPRHHQPGQHSAAFRSHSDGHCPNQTYVTRVEITMPETEDPRPKHRHCGQTRNPESDPKSGSEVGDSSGPARTEAASQYQDRCPEQQSEARKPESDPKSGTEANSGSRPARTKDSPSLQQIAAVLQNVEDLVVRVEAYSGTGRDKQYRFLDEMLTRCMLRLDDVDTEGREDVRGARKAALRRVQGCIDKLEAKAEESERRKQAGGASATEKDDGKQAESANTGKKGSGKQAESASADEEESKKQAVSANTNEIESGKQAGSASADEKESGKQAESTSVSEGGKSSEQMAGEECRIAVLVENPGKVVKESEEMECQEAETEETKL